jgi:hypothetical protein
MGARILNEVPFVGLDCAYSWYWLSRCTILEIFRLLHSSYTFRGPREARMSAETQKCKGGEEQQGRHDGDKDTPL